jgi:hypothetical protein
MPSYAASVVNASVGRCSGSTRRPGTRTPMIAPPRARYDLAERQQAVACGGLGMILDLIRATGLRQAINRAVPILKLHALYDEADHVLYIALNLLSG